MSKIVLRVMLWGSGFLALAAGVAGFTVGWNFLGAAAATPSVEIDPTASASTFTNGQVVQVTVGPNSVFQPGLKVNILECADPGGSAANLPKGIENCDGNTIQGDTVIVQPDGGISEKQYTIYQLPSQTLGEAPSWQPVCSQSDECVLYVGENQNDFTKPKLFSSPFFVSSSVTPTTFTNPTTSQAASQSASSNSSGGSPTQGDLAYTGVGQLFVWLFAVGTLLSTAGLFGLVLARTRTRT